jgi:G3E family GTPase
MYFRFMSKEPIIVIVGFLGAGKTTFLKKLVKDYLASDFSPYIILNDYENAKLDSQQLVELLDPNLIYPLNGSCICCSGVNELRQSVNEIPTRKNGITIIEANGTSDACKLMGFLGVGVREDFAPPVQVSIVDARNWQQRGEHNELEANQIQVSSLIILNFTDQVDKARLQTVREQIQELNPTAIIKEWNDLDALVLPQLQPSNNQAKAIDHLKSHWSSCSVDLPDPISTEKLNDVINRLPKSIIRVKGCTRLDNDEHYSYVERTPMGETAIRPFNGDLMTGPKLLVIGPGSNPDMLKKLLLE